MKEQGTKRHSVGHLPLGVVLLLVVWTLLMAPGCIQRFDDFCEGTEVKKDVTDGKETLSESIHGEGTVDPLDVSETRETTSEAWTDDICQPKCTGKECGPDGCGGSCGSCPGQEPCVDGSCVVCPPSCSGKCVGASDGCGGTCPTNNCSGCCSGTTCQGGTLNTECGKNGAGCTSCSTGKTCQSQACTVYCGDGVCASTGGETCATCGADCGCTLGQVCHDGSCCTPACSGKCAGASNECGGTCPSNGCSGCCSGTICQGGTSNTQCGKNGASCTNCTTAGKVCQDQACVTGETWYDSASGLTWQVTPTGGTMSWSSAQTHCSNLALAGGGWRLPHIGELRSLIRGCAATMTGGTCNVQPGTCLDWSCRHSSCDGCSSGGGPALGCYWPSEVQGTCSWYWSSSPVGDSADYRWLVFFYYGDVNYVGVNAATRVRCVR